MARTLQERQNITRKRREVRRPSTSSTPKNVETVRRLVHEDRRITIKDIAEIVNVSNGTVQMILACDLNMHRVAQASDPRTETAPCCNLSRASSACPG